MLAQLSSVACLSSLLLGQLEGLEHELLGVRRPFLLLKLVFVGDLFLCLGSVLETRALTDHFSACHQNAFEVKSHRAAPGGEACPAQLRTDVQLRPSVLAVSHSRFSFHCEFIPLTTFSLQMGEIKK